MFVTATIGAKAVHLAREVRSKRGKGKTVRLVTLCGAETVSNAKLGVYTKPVRATDAPATCKSCAKLAPAPEVTTPQPVTDIPVTTPNPTDTDRIVIKSEIFETLEIGIWEQMPLFA